ncbi:hypothetical protein PSPO01_12293 [Paraphaeosphaeria sporulosa]
MSSNKPQGHSRGKLLDKNGKPRFKAAKLSTSFIEDDFFDPATATNEDFELKLPKKATSTNANNKTKDEKGATGDAKSSGGVAASEASS